MPITLVFLPIIIGYIGIFLISKEISSSTIRTFTNITIILLAITINTLLAYCFVEIPEGKLNIEQIYYSITPKQNADNTVISKNNIYKAEETKLEPTTQIPTPTQEITKTPISSPIIETTAPTQQREKSVLVKPAVNINKCSGKIAICCDGTCGEETSKQNICSNNNGVCQWNP
ncbi:MAG: hypothetical protein WCJ19_00640 [bacterium]